MNDRPVDLSALRTPPPLDDRDYAAVRARVMSRIRRREPARWPWLLPLAAAMLLMFVFVGREPKAPPAPRQAAPVVIAAPQPVAAQPPVVAAQAVEEPRPSPVRLVSRSRRPPEEAPPVRIHMQTADPDVRIIWIVKEKS